MKILKDWELAAFKEMAQKLFEQGHPEANYISISRFGDIVFLSEQDVEIKDKQNFVCDACGEKWKQTVVIPTGILTCVEEYHHA